MYDTMKDRRIGIPEVIEKFGVPPEKVVEVQALAGDSTDNVPGVPGIGVKTAAQLIVEYGDLEQLLFRAGEIKQPKRREALIENAEKARISRQLVMLDDKVELDVPLDDLAVHEPDARKLIAFLKAMEFSTLTRRVAEYSQIDPADVEADAGNKSGASVVAAAAVRRRRQGMPRARRCSMHRRRPARRPHSQGADKQDKAASPKGTPISLAAARAEAARKLPVDRSKYQTIRNARRAQGLDRARLRRRQLRDRRQGELRRSDAGRDLRHRAGAGAERRLLRAARPQAIRRRRGPVRRRPRADQIKARRRAGRAEAAAGIDRAFSRSASTSSSTP